MLMGFVARNGFIHLARASSGKHHSFLELASYIFKSFFFPRGGSIFRGYRGLDPHSPINNKISSLFMAEKLKLQVVAVDYIFKCVYMPKISHIPIYAGISTPQVQLINTRDVFVFFI
jgi:hypothetical protein